MSGSTSASYVYNGAGERVSKTVNGTTTSYTWDPMGLGTVIADGTVENVFGPAGLAEQVTDTSQTAQFAGADALGSIRLITDDTGQVVGTGSYGAWGTPDRGSVTLGGFGFSGEQLDPETGFVSLRHRSYDPATGRFLTPDPLGFAGSGVNLYAYVGNNPATAIDPSGLNCFDPAAGGEGDCPGGGGGGDTPSSDGGGDAEGSMPRPPSGAGEFEPVGEGKVCPLNPATREFTPGVNPPAPEPFGSEGEGPPDLGASGSDEAGNPIRSVEIIERDGDTVWIRGSGPKGEIEIMTNMTRQGNDLVLSGTHIDGPGAGSLGIGELREFARELGREEGVERVIIQGAERSTGANPGKIPRTVVIKVK